MMHGWGGLIVQTVLEGAVVAWAGWQIWTLRTPKPKDAPPPSASPDAPGHAVGEHPLDDR